MTSLFAQLYLAIQAQIETLLDTEGKKVIKWIDQDMGQLETYKERPSVSFPCVLIDFPTAQYSEEGEKVQWAAINISIRLGFAPFTSANSVAPDISKEAALQYYEIENALVACLYGFTAGDCVQPMIRVSAATERRDDSYRVREIMFSTATEDDTMKEAVNSVATSLVVTTAPL